MKKIDNENWKEVNNYEGKYLVSDLGRVKIIDKKGERILKPYIKDLSSYPEVKLYKGSPRKGKNWRIHRLVGEHFLGILKGELINHIDGDKHNNVLSNLEKSDHLHNNTHARQTGLTNDYGTNSSNSKLKETDLYRITYLRKQGRTYQFIADEFKVSRETVRKVVIGKSYTNHNLKIS